MRGSGGGIPPQGRASGRSRIWSSAGLLGVAENPGVCRELKVAFGTSAIVGNVPVGITAYKQQKSVLVALGRVVFYWKNMQWLTECIGMTEPGWGKDEHGEAPAQRSHLG